MSGHPGLIVALPRPVTPPSWRWRITVSLIWQFVGRRGLLVPKGPVCSVKHYHSRNTQGKKKKRSQYLLWRPYDGAKQDAIWPCQPQEGKKIKMVLEQFGQEDNRILYFLAQQWMNLSSKCKAGIKSKDNKWWNGETSVPGTIMSFLCDHKENSPTELQRAVWTSILFLSKDN